MVSSERSWSWSLKGESTTSGAEEEPSFRSGGSAVILVNNRAENMEKTKSLEAAIGIRKRTTEEFNDH